MSKQRSMRERRALKFLMARRRVSAGELGEAAVDGDRKINWKARLNIGFALGFHFVKRGFARETITNDFEWVPPPTRK